MIMCRSCMVITWLLIQSVGFSQWVQTSGPEGGRFGAICSTNGIMLAGSEAGIWRSADSGYSWSSISGDAPADRVTTLIISGTKIFAGFNHSGIYCSTDNGIHWLQKNSGLGNFIVHNITESHSKLYACTGGGLYFSADSGENWHSFFGLIAGKNVLTLVVFGDTVIAGISGSGIIRSTDNGNSWQTGNNGLDDLSVLSLAGNENTLFAGTESGKVFISIDYGNTWNESSTGLAGAFPINSILCSESIIYSATGGNGVFFSSDNGNLWVPENNYLSNPFVLSFAENGNCLFAGTDGGGIFRYNRQISAWSNANDGLNASSVRVLCKSGSALLAGTYGGGFFFTDNNGFTWFPRNNGLASRYITAMVDLGEKWLIGTSGGGLYSSDNDGIDWKPAGTGISSSYISSLLKSEGNIFAGTKGSGIFVSLDSAQTWASAFNGINDLNITGLANYNGKIYAGTQSSGVFFSTDNGANWSPVNDSLGCLSVNMLASNGNVLFAGTQEGLYRLIYPDTAWEPCVDKGIPVHARAMTFAGNTVFAGNNGHKILMSGDNGSTWEDISSGLPEAGIQSLIVSGTLLYAGTAGSGTWKRPLSSIFTTQLAPDTVILKQTQGFTANLLIKSSVDWTVQGNIPDWVSLDKLSGSGTDTIHVNSLSPNLGFYPRYASLYIFSSVAPTVNLTIIQLGKTAGITDDETISGVNIIVSRGREEILISSIFPMREILVYSIAGHLQRRMVLHSDSASLAISEMSGQVCLIKIIGVSGWTYITKMKF